MNTPISDKKRNTAQHHPETTSSSENSLAVPASGSTKRNYDGIAVEPRQPEVTNTMRAPTSTVPLTLLEETRASINQVPENQVPNLVTNLLSTDITVQTEAAREIANLATDEDNQVTLRKTEGLVSALVNLLASSEVDVGREAARAIANLSQHKDNVLALLHTKGLMHGLFNMSKSPDVQSQREAVMAMAKLISCGPPQGKPKALVWGFIKQLASPDALVKRAATRGVGNLVATKGYSGLVDARGLVDGLINNLASEDIDTQRYAMHALRNLIQDPRNLNTLMQREDILPALVNHLTSNDADINGYATVALAELAVPPLNPVTLMQTPNLMVGLIRNLASPEPESNKYAAQLVHYLASNLDNHFMLKQMPDLMAGLNTMLTSPNDKTKAAGRSLLNKLQASDDKVQEDAIAKLRSLRGYTTLLPRPDLMAGWVQQLNAVDRPDSKTLAAVADLAELAANPGNLVALMQTPNLVAALKHNLDSKNVVLKKYVTLALINIGIHQNSRLALKKKTELVAAVNSMLSSPDATTTKSLALLAADPNNQVALRQTPELVAALINQIAKPEVAEFAFSALSHLGLDKSKIEIYQNNQFVLNQMPDLPAIMATLIDKLNSPTDQVYAAMMLEKLAANEHNQLVLGQTPGLITSVVNKLVTRRTDINDDHQFEQARSLRELVVGRLVQATDGPVGVSVASVLFSLTKRKENLAPLIATEGLLYILIERIHIEDEGYPDYGSRPVDRATEYSYKALENLSNQPGSQAVLMERAWMDMLIERIPESVMAKKVLANLSAHQGNQIELRSRMPLVRALRKYFHTRNAGIALVNIASHPNNQDWLMQTNLLDALIPCLIPRGNQSSFSAKAQAAAATTVIRHLTSRQDNQVPLLQMAGLLPGLITQLETNPDAQVQVDAIKAVSNLTSHEANQVALMQRPNFMAALVSQLVSTNDEINGHATKALANLAAHPLNQVELMQTPHLMTALIRNLDHSDDEVKKKATVALINIEIHQNSRLALAQNPVLAAAVNRILTSSDASTNRAATESLATLAANPRHQVALRQIPELMAVLIKQLENLDAEVNRFTNMALGFLEFHPNDIAIYQNTQLALMQTPDLMAELTRNLVSQDLEVNKQAALVLEDLVTHAHNQVVLREMPDLVAALNTMLTNPNVDIRAKGRLLLSRLDVT